MKHKMVIAFDDKDNTWIIEESAGILVGIGKKEKDNNEDWNLWLCLNGGKE